MDAKISDSEVSGLLSLLRSDALAPDDPLGALAYLGTTGDLRFVSVLIESMRAAQLGALPIDAPTTAQASLRRLTGESFVTWAEWVAWYATTDLTPVPGFAAWKGQIYAVIDPRFNLFFDEDHPRSIRFEELVWGGVGVDGIPPLESPPRVAAELASYLNPEDLVFGATINGESQAYPLRIMDWHEMANDTLGGEPVALAYCTLCGAGVLFSRRYRGKVLSFGTSGFLMRSNKLMYDRTTFTLWNQLTGVPVLGTLAADPGTLDVFPVVVTTWDAWRTANPTTSVLSVNTAHQRDYSPGAAYGGYFASPDTMFPAPQNDADLNLKDRVFALVLGGDSRAYPVATLVEARVLNDTLGAEPVVLVAQGEEFIVHGSDRRQGDVAWNAGAAVRAYRRGDRHFGPGPDATSLIDQNGATWEVTEEALVHPDGTRLDRLP